MLGTRMLQLLPALGVQEEEKVDQTATENYQGRIESNLLLSLPPNGQLGAISFSFAVNQPHYPNCAFCPSRLFPLASIHAPRVINDVYQDYNELYSSNYFLHSDLRMVCY